jgi:Ca2+/Na+ antiporter
MTDNKHHHWLTSLVPNLAFAAGIIMASVGAIMIVSSSLKLALFESEPYTIITEEECRYDYTKPITNPELGQKEQERSPEEIAQCMQRRHNEELVRFQNTEKRDIVDGVSAFLVGAILMAIFRHKRK